MIAIVYYSTLTYIYPIQWDFHVIKIVLLQFWFWYFKTTFFSASPITFTIINVY